MFSVSLPAVTKVSQVESINRFASAFTEGQLFHSEESIRNVKIIKKY